MARIVDASVKSTVPALSPSVAKTLVTKSPAHAYAEHPLLGGVPRESTDSMERGSLIHALVFGEGREIVVVDAKDWKTKAAQEARSAAREAGKLAVLAHKLAEVRETATAITNNLAEAGVILNGASEVKIEWEDEATDGSRVLCRGQLDHIVGDRIIYDLKIVDSAHPEACSRQAYAYGYDIQGAAYVRALSDLYPENAGRIDFVLLFAEPEPPFAVWPARFSGDMRHLGETRWQRAVDLWATCMAAKLWPGYADEIATLEAPAWALSREMSKQASEAAEAAFGSL
jgi:hypothetical protein